VYVVVNYVLENKQLKDINKKLKNYLDSPIDEINHYYVGLQSL
jgi:hypothetical protein